MAAVDGHREGLDEREDRAIDRILAGGHDVALDRSGLRVLGHLLLAIRSVAKDTGRADEGLVVRVGVAVPEDTCVGVTADVLALSVLEDIPVIIVGVVPHGRTRALVARRGGALRICTEEVEADPLGDELGGLVVGHTRFAELRGKRNLHDDRRRVVSGVHRNVHHVALYEPVDELSVLRGERRWVLRALELVGGFAARDHLGGHRGLGHGLRHDLARRHDGVRTRLLGVDVHARPLHRSPERGDVPLEHIFRHVRIPVEPLAQDALEPEVVRTTVHELL